jgi:formate/nitrite transporter FocA (FNT family)
MTWKLTELIVTSRRYSRETQNSASIEMHGMEGDPMKASWTKVFATGALCAFLGVIGVSVFASPTHHRRHHRHHHVVVRRIIHHRMNQ